LPSQCHTAPLSGLSLLNASLCKIGERLALSKGQCVARLVSLSKGRRPEGRRCTFAFYYQCIGKGWKKQRIKLRTRAKGVIMNLTRR